MKRLKKMGMAVMSTMVAAMPMVYAQEKSVESMINTITTALLSVVAGIATIYLIIAGIQFMGASDPEDKKRIGERIKYILIGLALTLVAGSVVRMVTG